MVKKKVEIGIVGLGRMGFGMSQRLLNKGFGVVGYNRSPGDVKKFVKKGGVGAYSIEELLSLMPRGKRIIWLMLPAGKVTDKMIKGLLGKMNKGDILIDGANAYYKNAEKHAEWSKKKGIHFFDVGVSGGVHGLKLGYTLMIGGPKKQFGRIEKFCKALAPKGGYGLFGETGMGHYTKSVHNIVEYVYLQGLAEGVEILDRKGVDVEKALNVWRPASVVRSWLVDLGALAFSRKDFRDLKPEIGSVTIGELRKTRRSSGAYAPAFREAVKVRKMKGKKFVLGRRVIAAIRREFGGHSVKK